LDDDQLFSLINNNREKNNDRKNKYKEIQDPRDRRDRDSRSSPQASRDDRDAYVSIPYTTAASEFLYGFNVVIAALTARRRQMYNVYIHSRALSNSSSASNIKNLCRKAGVRFTDVDDSFLPKMDKMAQGRPHNGLILEASPLPTLPTKSLGKIGVTDMAIPIELADQSAEEAKVNGTPSTIPFHYAHTWRKPLVLLLDGILDPGNLGNILRTAHFYGIDAVAICTNTCAPVNLPIVQKAASGAAEALTILSIPTPANFITTCKKHGWTVHAAVAPNATSAKSSKGNLVTSNMISPLSRSPSILMIGAEGEGLRANLATKADANVGIRGAKPALPELDVGVDSLNVGSSVAVLLEAFFKKPDNLEDVPEDTPRDDTVSGRIV
ncbi:alpha/beta knot, partial [Aureobasidium melanogenum]